MKLNASNGKRILWRPKHRMMKPFLQIRYLLIFGRAAEEGGEVGAGLMWIHSTAQTVFNNNVHIRNRPRGSGRTEQQRVLRPENTVSAANKSPPLIQIKTQFSQCLCCQHHSSGFYHITDTYHGGESGIVTKQF